MNLFFFAGDETIILSNLLNTLFIVALWLVCDKPKTTKPSIKHFWPHWANWEEYSEESVECMSLYKLGLVYHWKSLSTYSLKLSHFRWNGSNLFWLLKILMAGLTFFMVGLNFDGFGWLGSSSLLLQGLGPKTEK